MPTLPADNVGMKTKVATRRKTKSKPLQYTLRNVPPEVDQALRKLARQEGKSLNEVAVEALQRATTDGAPKKSINLEGIVGTWVEDPEFDRAMEDQRRIDPELWR